MLIDIEELSLFKRWQAKFPIIYFFYSKHCFLIFLFLFQDVVRKLFKKIILIECTDFNYLKDQYCQPYFLIMVMSFLIKPIGCFIQKNLIVSPLIMKTE